MTREEAATVGWEQRVRAPVSFLPAWSPSAPDRCVYASNESGVWQVYAWDAGAGERRQVTSSPVGLIDGVPTVDGEGILWFEDATGDESGRWLVQPFAGGETRAFLEGVPHGWSEGLAQAVGVVAAGLSDRDGFAVHVSLDGAPAREVYRSTESIRIGSVDQRGFLRGGLSADGSLLCLEHAEHGDLIHPALRVIDPRSGATVAEQHDPGMSLHAKCWAPRPGDQRLALEHERDGEARPAIWDLSTGERRDLQLELDGEVRVDDWWPDGDALLLKQLFEGRHRLFRFVIATGELQALPSEPGVIWKARVRPGGQVWFLHEQGHRQRRILDEAGAQVLPVQAAQTPASRPYRSSHFANPEGQRVHGVFVTPDDSGRPLPVR